MANLKHFNSATGKWEEIKVSTKFKDLLNTVKLTQDQNYVNIGITNYNPVEDVIFVFLNSTWLQKDQDYVINGGLLRIESKDGSNWSNGDTFNFVVLKNVDKDDLPSADGSLIQNGSITIAKLANGLQTYINKIGTAELATVADDLSGAVNELSSQMNDNTNNLNSITQYVDTSLEDYTECLDTILNNSLITKDKKIRIILPDGIDINFSTVNLTRNNIEFTGGCINGNLKINVDEPEDSRFININFDSVKFKKDIEIVKGRGIQFNNCIFEHTDKSIYCNPPDDAVIHGIGLVGIYGCRFYDVNYNLYINKNTNSSADLQCNDFIFSNNYSNVANITGIYAEEIDGIEIVLNTFFTQDNGEREKYNIQINQGDWITIDENHLWGAGYESILLNNCYHQKINNNMIAWNGQKKPSSGIKITCDPDRHALTQLEAQGNFIIRCTLHGIEINNVDFTNIKNNTFECKIANDSLYFGETDLSTLEHYGVYTNVKTYTNAIKDNILISGTAMINKDVNLNNITTMKTSDAPNINNSKNNVIIFACDQAVLFNNILYGCNGEELTLIALNSNTSLESNNLIRLKKSSSLNIPSGGVLKLLKINNVWFETSRNFDIVSQ